MKASRIALAAAAAASLVTSLVSAGTAADAASTSAHSKRVCAHAATGYVACDARVRTDANLKPLATQGPTGYSPAQLKSAYGLTGLTGTTTVAIVDAYAHPNAAADLAVYRNTFGLGAANLTQYNQTGGSITTVSGNTGWGQEEMLDLEMVSAICPGCPIIYVGANSAAFSSVVAVGGTHLTLTSTGARSSETVWSGAGSGCSSYIGKPSWQHDPGCARRTIGDVSAVADPTTGVSVYNSYGSTGGNNWYVFGGTSVSAPIIGGVFGLKGTGSNTAASKLYAAPAGSLFDVKSGSNGRCTHGKNTANAYLCTGVAGYDGPTGNGTPNGTGAF